ncbi:phthalate transporter [Penicillium riverlandense]|uniref:phthalate transporter n=1 Tax=Penicillium riverlandense TaxID=1903569 RepID=UPI0025486BE6|nr:phthalate transporter [Penicillium riverlandense]KAJ5826182.1 phthalate transporter [Penicillium riverlandense]
MDPKESSEHVEMMDSPVSNDDFGFTLRQQRHIFHKIDRRLITGLGLLLGVSLMDRTNLGNASIAGMQEDLGLTVGSRYSLIVLIFFVPYVLFQLPSSIIVRKVGPRQFLAGITFLWGVVMMCFGFVHDWKVMMGLRVVLGTFEAGLFPGAVYLLSLWYPRYDVHKRYSSFYLISTIGASLSGVLAYGFMQMAGLGGLSAWQWIFVMEGLLTCVLAVIGYFLIISFPQDAHKAHHFLSRQELDFVLHQLERDRRDVKEEAFSWSAFLKPALELKVWGFAMIFLCATVVAYSLAFFLPIILFSRMGFSVGVSQALCTPPYVWAGIVMYAEGWLGDKWHCRSPFIILNALQAIVGLCLLEWTSSPGVQYFGVFLVCAGCNANVPAVLSWQANNIRGQWKRAFCSASMISFGGTGGIVGALVFRAQDVPEYFPGVVASIVCNVIILIIAGMLTLYMYKANQKAKRGIKSCSGINFSDNTELLFETYEKHLSQEDSQDKAPSIYGRSPESSPKCSLPSSGT